MKRKLEGNNNIQNLRISTPEEIFIDKDTFHTELSSYILCLQRFESMYKGTVYQQQDALFQILRINSNLIPQLYYHYSVFLNKELINLSQNKKQNPSKALAEIEQELETLDSLFSIQKMNRSLHDNIKEQLAKSYELIADHQYDIFILNKKYSLRLLQQIFNNYSKSLENKFDVPVWLSLINTRRMLVEKFKNAAKEFYPKDLLLEINSIVNEISNFSLTIDEESMMIMISHMLYACANGYQFNKYQGSNYIKQALNLVSNNLDLLIKNQDNEEYEDIYGPIFNHLKILGINENIEEFKPNLNLEQCILNAKKFMLARQPKSTSDFNKGTLVSSPETIAEQEILASLSFIKDYNSIQSDERPLISSPKKIESMVVDNPKSIVKTLPFFKISNNKNEKDSLTGTCDFPIEIH